MGQDINTEKTYRIVFCGPPASGKSCLIQSLLGVENALYKPYQSTLAVDFDILPFTPGDFKEETETKKEFLHLWDTSGNKVEATQAYLKKMSEREPPIIAICVDVAQEDAGRKAREWYDKVKEVLPRDSQIILVATKCDRLLNNDAQCQGNCAELENFARKNGMRFYQADAYNETIAWMAADGQLQHGNLRKMFPEELRNIAAQSTVAPRPDEQKEVPSSSAPQPPPLPSVAQSMVVVPPTASHTAASSSPPSLSEGETTSQTSNSRWTTFLKYLYFVAAPPLGVYFGMTKLAPSILSGSLPIIVSAGAAVISPLFAYLFENECKDSLQRHKGYLAFLSALVAAFGFTFLSLESPAAITTYTGDLVVGAIALGAATLGTIFLNIIGLPWLVDKIFPSEKLLELPKSEPSDSGERLSGVPSRLREENAATASLGIATRPAGGAPWKDYVSNATVQP